MESSSSCNTHEEKLLTCTYPNCSNNFICRICVFKSKSEIDHWYDHFDFITTLSKTNTKYLDIIDDYEGFKIINKVYKSMIFSIDLKRQYFIRLNSSEHKILYSFKDAFVEIYQDITKKFENLVTNITESANNLDLNVNSAYHELDQMKTELDDKIKFLESEEKIKNEFKRIFENFSRIMKILTLKKLADENFKLKVNFKAACLNFQNGTPNIRSSVQVASYWREVSEEILDGEFFCRIKIHNIETNVEWGVCVGLIRADSTNRNEYYRDSLLFMSTGKINMKFLHRTGREFLRPWQIGDEILIRRDAFNDVYFGLNEEDSFEQAYSSIFGSFHVVVGFKSSRTGDHLEIIDLEYPK